MSEIRLGRYRHFKGKIYCVLGVAKNSENNEEYVIYSDGDQMWARPKQMFLEEIEQDGYKGPRFQFIGD